MMSAICLRDDEQNPKFLFIYFLKANNTNICPLQQDFKEQTSRKVIEAGLNDAGLV